MRQPVDEPPTGAAHPQYHGVMQPAEYISRPNARTSMDGGGGVDPDAMATVLGLRRQIPIHYRFRDQAGHQTEKAVA